MMRTRLKTWLFLLSLLLSLAAAGQPATAPVDFNIDSQPIGDAINAFAAQTGLQVLLRVESIPEGLVGSRVSGKLTPEAALKQLLANTSLQFTFIDERTIAVINPKDSKPSLTSRAGQTEAAGIMRLAETQEAKEMQASAATTQVKAPQSTDSREIVVTGSQIRGVYPESSPLTIYDAEDIARTGATTLEQFVQKLPQQLNTLTENAPGIAFGRVGNLGAVNGINLRGLGTGTTLVLLNGRRLAPAQSGSAVDISMLPLGAIKQVEVLTDGASAIYGADAVGGVVNIRLRDDFTGAHTALGYGSVTEGGREEVRVMQSYGRAWSSGRAALSYNFLDHSSLEAQERDYAALAAPQTLLPDERRHGALMTFEQDAFAGVTVSGDLLYSARRNANLRRAGAAAQTTDTATRTETEQYFTNFAATRDFAEGLAAMAAVSYSSFDMDQSQSSFRISTGVTTPTLIAQKSSVLDFTGKLDGDLAALPGGTLKFSAGGGYSRDALKSFVSNAAGGNFNLDRSTRYAFGELFVPLVAPESQVPFVRRLELSVAGRYTDYSDFGEETSPKVGLSWSPAGLLNLRATYGSSFRAPSLSQLDPSSASTSIFRPSAFGLPDIWSTNNSSMLLNVTGAGNPDLGPETADSWTAGFDLRLQSVPRLRVAATYFSIDYSNRIDSPPLTATTAPQNFPDLFIVNPTLAQVTNAITGATNFLNQSTANPNDPAAVAAAVNVLFLNRIRNLAISRLDGLDASIDYGFGGAGGEFTLGAQLSYLFDYKQRVTLLSPVVTVVDTLLNPPDLKARTYLGFSRAGFTTQLNVNYVDAYSNPLTVGAGPVESWTTLDCNLSYAFSSVASAWLQDSRVSLSVRNVLDEDPPFVPVGTSTNVTLNRPIGFDPTNADPLGRFVSLEFSKRWGSAGR